MNIEKIDPQKAELLIDELDKYQQSLYPPESNHLDSIKVLRKPNVIFLGAIEGENVLAIGAVKMFSGYGEIKRVYVPPEQRGKGLAKSIMRELEKRLVDQGIFTARLETGIYQKEAISLYKALGYVKRPPFGEYSNDPLCVFMEKTLQE